MLNAQLNKTLAEEISKFYADPLGFVRFAFPWGNAGGKLLKVVEMQYKYGTQGEGQKKTLVLAVGGDEEEESRAKSA